MLDEPALYTTFGPLRRADLGAILPHEHVFVEFRLPEHPEHAKAATADVVALMAPEVTKLRPLGVTAMVDCTPVGVGRRPDIVLAVSRAANLPIVVPTGIYREPWIPRWAQDASEAEIEAWMLGELNAGFAEAPFRAGWIKLSAGDDGISKQEARILRAAARASAATGAVIGSHTIRGRVVMDQLDIIAAAGGSASRFISIHTQAEPDFALHRALAARGAWIEYDNIGWVPHDETLARITQALDAGLAPRLLLSHDAGWFDPAKPGGGTPMPYTPLFTDILPALRRDGVDDATLQTLTVDNPFAAFARPIGD